MPPNKVIVVDSSESPLDLNLISDFNFKFDYLRTEIASAAAQRNLGINSLTKQNSYLIFLDDDTCPDPEYIDKLVSSMHFTNAIGMSGVTVDLNNNSPYRNTRGIGFTFRRLFLLDSPRDGSITKGGIGIPVRMGREQPIEVRWLIGCSIWNFEHISDIRFEDDFSGQSLGEDIIFSYLCSKRGKLFVDPRIKLKHIESSLGRPNYFTIQKMWITNRFRLFNKMDGRFKKYIYFNWANLGRLLSLMSRSLASPSESKEAIKGFFAGYRNIRSGQK